MTGQIIPYPATKAHSRSQSRLRMNAARANAARFAAQIAGEEDEAMKAYLFKLAMSWNGIAEQQEFLADMDERWAANGR
ncbi:MAG: hypothetical protein AB7K04_10510 [Pseudorhodoplanes sp.]